MTETCSIEPFRYLSTPVPDNDPGASGNQINDQAIEAYLTRLIRAVCADLTSIDDRIDALEARITALEAP